MNKAIVLAVGLLFAAAAAAQQYKWVDQDGKVRYGDVPPPGVKATPMKPPAASTPAPAAGPKKDAKPLTPEQAFQKRQKDQQEQEEKAAKDRSENEAKRVNCEQAQAQLRNIESGQRISTTNAAGERVYLEDAQLAKERERAQRAVGEWCK
jgi:hypothetical protein